MTRHVDFLRQQFSWSFQMIFCILILSLAIFGLSIPILSCQIKQLMFNVLRLTVSTRIHKSKYICVDVE